MLDAITSVPTVAGVALVTAVLFVLDMIAGEKGRPTETVRHEGSPGSGAVAQLARFVSRMRYRAFGLACALILLDLVALRFLALAG